MNDASFMDWKDVWVDPLGEQMGTRQGLAHNVNDVKMTSDPATDATTTNTTRGNDLYMDEGSVTRTDYRMETTKLKYSCVCSVLAFTKVR